MAARAKFYADWASLLLGTGLGITVAIYVQNTTARDWTWPYPTIISLSRICAMVGTYLALVGLVMVSRISWIEKSVGHDRLVLWHRKLGPYSLFLIAFHVLFVGLGYAGNEGLRVGTELWKMTLNYDWMLPASVGFLFFMAAGLTSYKRVRSKMSYETWWTIHLYTYLAIALSFLHQIRTGAMFIGHPLAKGYWEGLYILTAFTIIYWRVVIPVYRSFRHDLRVAEVIDEGSNIVSIVMRGHKLDRLNAQGGQFFSWRFMTPGQWWIAHPYSLSAAPTSEEMRVTVKNLGDASGQVGTLKPGTKVFFEGPFGVFTASKATRGLGHVVLVGGGVGITPLRALMEEFDESVEVDVLFRAKNDSELVFKSELDELAQLRGAKVHYLLGSRKDHPMNATHIMKYVPSFRYSDVYVCGPTKLVEAVREAALACGIPKERFHAEAFEFHAE
jgi:predicted ferric reductase